MSQIIVQGRPTNLRRPPEAMHAHVDGDVYRICERIPEEVEGGERLYIVMHWGAKRPYVVMEKCDDGVDRFYWRFENLDYRVIESLRRARAIPLGKRLDAVEKQEEVEAVERKEEEVQELYERFGGQMRHDLNRLGFTGTARSGVEMPLRKTPRKGV